MENEREKRRRQAILRAEQRKKRKRTENVLILICSTILAIAISMVWNLITYTSSVLFPPRARLIIDEESINFALPENYAKYLDIEYTKMEYFDRYLNYESLYPDLSLVDIVTYCNMGIDVEYFSRDAIVVNETDDINIVINKVYKLPNSYVPKDLVVVDDYRSQSMREEAALAFKDLKQKCKDMGFDLLAYSGYRSTDLQTTIYNNMVDLKGVEYTDQYVSRPGHSEHTTGLAVDISINGTDYNYSHENEHYDDLLSVLGDYGFIIRYPEGKEDLTGYGYESWHIRYVGVDVANEIEETGLTLDEYVARL